jgi:hypothetical protein
MFGSNQTSQVKIKIEKIMWIIDYWIVNIKQYLNFLKIGEKLIDD